MSSFAIYCAVITVISSPLGVCSVTTTDVGVGSSVGVGSGVGVGVAVGSGVGVGVAVAVGTAVGVGAIVAVGAAVGVVFGGSSGKISGKEHLSN